MYYKSTILQSLEAGRSSITDVRCIMLQSTGVKDELAYTFYDTTNTNKRYAHYVIDKTDVVKYSYSDTSVLNQAVFTERAALFKNAQSDDSPANHILVVEICLADDYAAIEKNVIKFLGSFLKAHGLTTDNLWRLRDIVGRLDLNTPQYAAAADWEKFLSAVKSYVEELNKPTPDLENVVATGIVIPTSPIPEDDKRDIKTFNSFKVSDLAEEDYEITKVGDVQTKRDKFTGKIESTGTTGSYEPIYPDLTVPPVQDTGLYNKRVDDIREEKNAFKPVLGKSVNNQDPYPVDDKIIELEQHFPIMKMDDSVLNQISGSTDAMARYLVSLSQRAEQRVVQLENVTATLMRYLFRMSSRLNVNCVYYGGQSVYGKYNCIRCLADDMVNDGQVVTLDQCLNCARYEPMLGQVYEILNDQMNPDLAAILDDNQMARMSMDERIKFSRLEKMADGAVNATCEQDKLSTKDTDDKNFAETFQGESSVVMIWQETPLETQAPDVNEYSYDHAKKLENQTTVLDPANRHKDYYKETPKKQIPAKANSYNISGGSSSSSGSGGNGGSYGISDYDFTGAEKRLQIIETAQALVNLGKQEKCQYVLGGRIYDKFFSKTPDELYQMIQDGEAVNYTSAEAFRSNKVLNLDCSAFVRYCYMHNGVSIPDISSAQANFCSVVGEKRSFAASIADAVPGDLIFYAGDNDNVYHVALYIGSGKILHASTDDRAPNDQVREGTVYSEGFYMVGRHPDLAKPKLKNLRNVQIDMTLDEAAQIQLSSSTGAGGGDHEPTTLEEVKSYLDPTKHMSGNERYQFMDLSSPCGVTADELVTFFTNVGAAQSLIDNAQAYVDAGQKYGINEIYLAAHSCLETGYGNEGMAVGVIGPSGRTVYNMYGIWAYNNDGNRTAARANAEAQGWFTVRDAIIGGAKFVAESYIAVGQKTLYYMRWNPTNPGQHQYATDVAWAVKQTSSIAKILDGLSDEAKAKLIYEIPVYKS